MAKMPTKFKVLVWVYSRTLPRKKLAREVTSITEGYSHIQSEVVDEEESDEEYMENRRREMAVRRRQPVVARGQGPRTRRSLESGCLMTKDQVSQRKEEYSHT